MNRVDIGAFGVASPDWAARAGEFAAAVCDKLFCDKWDLSLLFCDDAFIRDLNRRFRDRDEPTDVLSFPLGETFVENGEERYAGGDIVISLESLRANCKAFNVGEDEELRRLLIHGILHLKGLDHATNAPEEEMLLLQERLLKDPALAFLRCIQAD
ncbi:MAG: rRNA maturation RNase YbeY [Spirochaetaceae bacterium]|jgi:probable rRNA maturation factor|nr:rRNA maturation RNase YbeY [Spirochaetaceae bacterium]